MPKYYTLEQKKERIVFLEERIQLAREHGFWKEVKRLQNIKFMQKNKWKDDLV